jgi:hypothetical protein
VKNTSDPKKCNGDTECGLGPKKCPLFEYYSQSLSTKWPFCRKTIISKKRDLRTLMEP